MTQESWVIFTQVSESRVAELLPGVHPGSLASYLQHVSVDGIWDILLDVLNTAARVAIPQRRLGGEARPPKEEVPINRGLNLLGRLLHCITTVSGQCEATVQSEWGCLKRTYASLVAVIAMPELQTALHDTGLTTMPELPPPFPTLTLPWQYFQEGSPKALECTQISSYFTAGTYQS